MANIDVIRRLAPKYNEIADKRKSFRENMRAQSQVRLDPGKVFRYQSPQFSDLQDDDHEIYHQDGSKYLNEYYGEQCRSTREYEEIWE